MEFYKLNVLLVFLVSACAFGCGDAKPQVAFLETIGSKNNIPKIPGTSNLSLTTDLTGTGYILKSRVSYIGAQTSLSGGNYKINGKISY
jgi:hypothetical protein